MMTIATASEAILTRAISKKRVVAVGADLTGTAAIKPDLSWAQIALINQNTWCVIGPFRQISGLIDSLSLEGLSCPIVLTTEIPRRNLGWIIEHRVSISGVDDIKGMVRNLQDSGGIVICPTA